MRVATAFALASFVALPSFFGAGCRSHDARTAPGEEIRTILSRVSAARIAPAVLADVGAFYAARSGEPAWTTQPDLPKAKEALALLRTAYEHGLAPSDYGEPQIALLVTTVDECRERNSPNLPRRLAELDVRVTTGLLAFGRDVAIGRTSPEAFDARWRARRTDFDFAGTLSRSADLELGTWLETLRPPHAEYAALESALAKLERERARAPSDASVVAKIRTVALNLERWRWMPDELGPRHLLVNIPEYRVMAREHGKRVLDVRAVVGKPSSPTPVFSALLTNVVFSPYWHIPETIAIRETAPAVASDPDYLASQGIEVVRHAGAGRSLVDPASVDWNDPDELRRLSLQQRPGPKNALGKVKFFFLNYFSVYLHDTPAEIQFARDRRALSHGCIRVEEPEALARYVFRGDPRWGDDEITAAMARDSERHVKLRERIPIHIVYFTAWVDEQANLVIFPDVYGFDAKQAAAEADHRCL